MVEKIAIVLASPVIILIAIGFMMLATVMVYAIGATLAKVRNTFYGNGSSD